jgi:hypothetical protein
VTGVESRTIAFGEKSYIYHYTRLALDGAPASLPQENRDLLQSPA